MNVITTPLAGAYVLEPKLFGDARGFFLETYNARATREALGINDDFVQDNHSRSAKNVLRGMHYQIRQPQGKLVHVVRGRIYDVVVDLRRSSPTLGQSFGIELSEDNHTQFWVPAGFAHGFLVLSDVADVLYKTTNYYAPQHERCIHWDDPTLKIEWPLNGSPVLSARDQQGVAFADADLFD